MTENYTIQDYRGLIDADDASFCPHIDCECDLVYPITWEDVAMEGLSKVVLRCPNCERTRSGYMDDDEAEYLRYMMEIGRDSILDGYKAIISDEELEKIRTVVDEPDEEDL